MSVVLAPLERLLHEAKSRAGSLARPDLDVMDMVLIEVVRSHLDSALTVLQAAASDEGADYKAPEEPPASAH